MHKCVIFCVLIAIIAFIAGISVGKDYSQAQKWAVEEYQMRTDNLIQAIDCDWESFEDVTMETDEWAAYREAEKEVLKVISEWD